MIERYPRTMQEAFGPYASNHIEEPARPTGRAWKIVYTLAVVAVIVVVCLR